MLKMLISELFILKELVPGLLVYRIFILGILMLKVFILLKVLVSSLLVSRVFVFAVNMIDLDTKVSDQKTMIVIIFETIGDGLYRVITLINEDTTMLFQTVILGCEI